MTGMLSAAARAVRRILPLPPPSGARPPRRLVLALLALCAVAFGIRLAHIAGTLPYPRHIDEVRITVRAHGMVTTGEYHPIDFIYPSLPRYLAAAAMAAGVAWTPAEERPPGSDPVGLWTYPHYERPAVIGAARRLFALLSVVALGATGLAAWRFLQWPGALLLAPLVLATSRLFFTHSWEYLNVDVVAACFAALGIAACLHGTRRPSVAALAVVPGICAGLAAGSKYPSGLALAPAVVAAALFLEPGRRLAGVARPRQPPPPRSCVFRTACSTSPLLPRPHAEAAATLPAPPATRRCRLSQLAFSAALPGSSAGRACSRRRRPGRGGRRRLARTLVLVSFPSPCSPC